eukprot:CAMPEP_0114623260 /NCGR_PEP_ID=MMETSP0168-20121206/10155_1 /TAXON_ID=95228 ORGANISM="Vannella sp., Strain DIVA3 517/6/12" /NCGR_SAMPLE_ID=MMETSP0168 /ASSEMBLY_ACC=CAM_ASM_000044 /LENGTH=265 /DNA_ID=CAMNT_0001834489 /DNA_START=71 /DNA_END=865 /DNA_ORIENTATION=+
MSGLSGLLGAYGNPEEESSAGSSSATEAPLSALACYGSGDDSSTAREQGGEQRGVEKQSEESIAQERAAREREEREREEQVRAEQAKAAEDQRRRKELVDEMLRQEMLQGPSAESVRLRRLALQALDGGSSAGPRSEDVTKRILQIRKLRSRGKTVNSNLHKSKAFYNPKILEKVVAFCGIDEVASNCPKMFYDPKRFQPEQYYDAIAAQQARQEEQRKVAQQSRTSVAYVPAGGSSRSDTTRENIRTSAGGVPVTVVRAARPRS